MFKKMSFGEIFTILIVLLGFSGAVGVAFYKINFLESEEKNRKLEIGQIRHKIMMSNQVNIDFLLKSKIDEKAKEAFKKRFDKINTDWQQFLDGGDVEGPSLVGHEINQHIKP